MVDRRSVGAVSLCALLLAAACSTGTGGAPTDHAPSSAAGSTWQLDRSMVDVGVDPCDDFYRHACGGWIARTNIPPDRDQVARAGDRSAERARAALEAILTPGEPSEDREVARLRAFYGACMATGPAADAAGREALAPWLDRVEAISSRADLERTARDLHAIGVSAFFDYSGAPDRTDATRYRAQIHQGAVRLPPGDQGSPKARRTRSAYRDHIARMFVLLGMDDARARRDAAEVVDIEATLAAASIPFQDTFDASKSEHPMPPSALRALAPHIDWTAALAAVGHDPSRPINVTSPGYLKTMDRVLATRPLGGLRAYLRWQLLWALAADLPGPLAEESHRYESGGSVARPPRSQECQLATLKGLGVELSRQFALRTLGPAGRARASEMISRVRDVVTEIVSRATWLSPGAAAATAEKLRMLDLKVGYPDDWPPTGTFELRPDAHLANVLAARRFERRRSWERAGRARTRTSWEMMVYPNGAPGMAASRLVISNAYPDAFTNSMIFSAAALQPPGFDPSAPVAVRYGTLGRIAGHEIGHVVDLHMFDAVGAERELWAERDVKAYEARRACVVAQASAFVAYGDVHLDGARTVHENVADLGGASFAYEALRREIGRAIDRPAEDGLTPAQQFFYAFAGSYCAKSRPAAERESLKSDGHAPPRFRVNGPLSNMPAFAEAFSCPPGAAMVRPRQDRCSVW